MDPSFNKMHKKLRTGPSRSSLVKIQSVGSEPFSCKILPPGGLLELAMKRDLADPGTDSVPLTRQTLLSRLRDWQDQEGWQEFFDTYWRLIYNVARKAGLDRDPGARCGPRDLYLSLPPDAEVPV